MRLDRFLLHARPDLGRRAIDRLLRLGAVSVGGRPRDARHFVKHGDLVVVSDRPAVETGVPREIIRTPRLIAVGKPPGMPTNPVGGQGEDRGKQGADLLSWVIDHCVAHDLPGKPGIVHRLDRDTSGVVLFSLDPEAHTAVEAAFRVRAVRKRYLALVSGELHPRRGTIDLSLTRDGSGRVRVSPKGAASRTDYETLRSMREMSLLEIRPRTGRMHQIRAHLAAVGHPIAGDPLYGNPRSGSGAPRLWLHALRLDLPAELAAALVAPAVIECPLWDDLAAHLRTLGMGPDGLVGPAA